MQLQGEGASVGGKRGVERAARVHHEGIALDKECANLAEARMRDLWSRPL
jgi:hypothetical protein